MLWTAISVAFFGLLRVSEYTCASASSFDPQRALLRRNVTISDSILTLLLPMSKTDQLREGAAVSIGVTGDGLCPVSAMAAYLANSSHNARAQPLYQFADGRFLTANDINFWLGQLMEPGVTSHSLTIGGATRIAELGAPTWQLQASGR